MQLIVKGLNSSEALVEVWKVRWLGSHLTFYISRTSLLFSFGCGVKHAESVPRHIVPSRDDFSERGIFVLTPGCRLARAPASCFTAGMALPYKIPTLLYCFNERDRACCSIGARNRTSTSGVLAVAS